MAMTEHPIDLDALEATAWTWPEDSKPTPAQFADWFADLPRDERIERAETILDALDRADVCFLQNHADLIERVGVAEAATVALARDLVQTIARVEALADELANPDPSLITPIERAHRRTVGRELRAALAPTDESGGA